MTPVCVNLYQLQREVDTTALHFSVRLQDPRNIGALTLTLAVLRDASSITIQLTSGYLTILPWYYGRRHRIGG